MINEKEAQDLMVSLIDLRKKVKEDPSFIPALKKHENECIRKFKYLVSMKTGRYKSFNNYDDLNQEGYLALIYAMNNYNPTKGSFFWWAHKYIDTRISRSANLHTAIRYPLKVAKTTAPHKEAVMPILIESRYCPDKQLEECQIDRAINNSLSKLKEEQRVIVGLAFGLADKPMSINKICKKLNISRLQCLKNLSSALSSMKDNIKV